MYRSNEKKPDIQNISLQEMLKDNLLAHSSLIYRIFMVIFIKIFSKNSLSKNKDCKKRI